MPPRDSNSGPRAFPPSRRGQKYHTKVTHDYFDSWWDGGGDNLKRQDSSCEWMSLKKLRGSRGRFSRRTAVPSVRVFHVRVHLVSFDSPPAGALSSSSTSPGLTLMGGRCLPTDSPLFAAIVVRLPQWSTVAHDRPSLEPLCVR